MDESTRSQGLKNRFRNPEVTIAVGLVALGAAIYSVETYLSPTLFLNDGEPAAVAAVFGTIALLYLAVFVGFEAFDNSHV